MSQLLKYSAINASEVLSWIQTPEELMNWAAIKDFPLSDISVFEQWHKDPEIQSYLLQQHREYIGYGEIWYDARDNSVELARLVINPKYRRQGFGQELIKQLLNCIKDQGFQTVILRLFPTNIIAKSCYEKVGFRKMPPEIEAENNADQSYIFDWMSYEFPQ
jgi:ribosomal protein S18 acetylase RimI-like enzyme